ncbi:MAG: family 10 glycosylhydrolase [Planctomycetota bacterium]
MRSSFPSRWPTAAALAVLAMPAAAIAATPGSATGAFKDTRALWMSRFEFTTETQIRQRVAAVADAGFTDLYFQVRGQGDVLYPSAIETWDNKYGGGFGPRSGPGFDPLAVALDAADDHGLGVHAWINTVPMWRDTSSPHTPPSNPNHFYNARPDLRLKDVNGNDMPLSSGQYVGVNPTHPDTADHVADLAEELVTNYGALGLQGVHLDYIRMVTNGASGPLTYPQDPDTRARFFTETGLNATTNPNTYKQWVGDKITVLVESVRDRIRGVDPNAQLTAAVWRDYEIGGRDYQQFADDWVRNGSLDTAFPMVYTTDDDLFRDNTLRYKTLDQQAGVAIGLGSYLHSSSAQTLRQLDTAQYLGANGFNIFSYGTLFSGSSLTTFGQDVKAYNEELAARADDNLPITTFEDGDAGYFGNSPTISGSNLGIDPATAATITTETAYEGDASQRIDIVASGSEGDDWFLRHLSGDSGGLASPAGNRELIADGYLGFWLRTLDEGLSVRVALDDTRLSGGRSIIERGLERDVIADGNWHLYEWNLDDNTQWDGWVSGDGDINGATVTLDSIQFFGAGDATVWLDAVMFDPFGTLAAATAIALAGDFDGSGQVEQGDLNLVLNNWGQPRGDWDNADGFATAGVDQEELNAVLTNWGDAATPDLRGAAVPEPGVALLAAAASVVGLRRRGAWSCCSPRAGGGERVSGDTPLARATHVNVRCFPGGSIKILAWFTQTICVAGR